MACSCAFPEIVTRAAAPGSTDRRDGVAVLRPRFLCGSGSDGPILAVADCAHPARGHPFGREVGRGGEGAAIAQCDVVLFGAALVAISGDLNIDSLVRIEPGGLDVQGGAGVVANNRAIQVEENLIASG